MALELALPGEVIALSAQTADTLLRSGSGDGALLYLWLLRHGGDTPLDKARHAFGWDGVRLEAAQAVLTGLGLAKVAQPAPPPRPEPQSPPEYTAADLTRELDNAASPSPVWWPRYSGGWGRFSPPPTCGACTPCTTIWAFRRRSSACW